jgi:hypothetical protein
MTGKNGTARAVHAQPRRTRKKRESEDEPTQVTRIYGVAECALDETKERAAALQSKMDWLLDDLDEDPTDPGLEALPDEGV